MSYSTLFGERCGIRRKSCTVYSELAHEASMLKMPKMPKSWLSDEAGRAAEDVEDGTVAEDAEDGTAGEPGWIASVRSAQGFG